MLAIALLLPGLLVMAAAPDALVAQQAAVEADRSGSETAQRRPVPEPVVPPGFFRRAVEAGTRTTTGRPAPAYWTQWSTYEIEARLEPETGRIEGAGRIRYQNRSPDTLRVLGLNLYQNLHQAGNVRNEPVEITGGVDLQVLRVDGETLEPRAGRPGPGYDVRGTVLAARPPDPVAPGDTVEIEVEWSFEMPQAGAAGRVGWSEPGGERELYFVGYWFPKMVVYDDLRGWDGEPYLGNGEFYDGFADYRVSLTVPTGWSVMATGTLENPAAVYTDQVLDRIDAASTADSLVAVVDEGDRAAGRVTTEPSSGQLTYRFRADSVRDFAWTASDVQRWTATSAVVPDRDGDGADDRVLIHSFWRPDRAPLWEEQALYARHAVEHHSRYTSFSYPWSHMTSVEGADIIGGGMEFPMMTVMGPYRGRDDEALYNVTSHEIAHMWIPMVVSTNERRHAWMDEGSTSFLENQGRPDYWPGTDAHGVERANYLSIAREGLEEPIMQHADYYPPGPAYGTAAYPKPATLLVTLRGLLGEDAFHNAYRGFIEDWAYGHPTPWDFFNAFEEEAGRDLDWFWTSWYFRTWVMDHAIVDVVEADVLEDGAVAPEVEEEGTRTVIVVEDRGWAVMPSRVQVRTTGGASIDRTVPVERWLKGAVRARVEVPVPRDEVERVELDPEAQFPDIDRDNNVWRPQ